MRKLLALLAWATAAVVSASPVAATSASGPRGDRPAGTGLLDVASDPPAEVFIDDADTGKVTPQPRMELNVGHHKLTLVSKRDSVVKRTIGFNVEAGKTTRLTIHLTS